MLSEPLPFPNQIPAGYEQLENEPHFNASRHLALEPPERVETLDAFGYAKEDLAERPTTFAITTPFRVLSEEGLAAMREVSQAFSQLDQRVEGHPGTAYLKPRGAAYSSQFVRDLVQAKELTEFLSNVSTVPLAPHSMPTLGASLNYSPATAETSNQGWHFDSVDFSLVVMLSDPDSMSGGAFQYFQGSNREIAALMGVATPETVRNPIGAKGPLPDERVVTVRYPRAGYGVFMQGYFILHRGQPLEEWAPRTVLVPTFVARDQCFPDVTNWAEMSKLNSPAIAREYARHKAWRARARLNSLIEELQFDGDVEDLRDALDHASTEIAEAKEALDDTDGRGGMSFPPLAGHVGYAAGLASC